MVSRASGKSQCRAISSQPCWSCYIMLHHVDQMIIPLPSDAIRCHQMPSDAIRVHTSLILCRGTPVNRRGKDSRLSPRMRWCLRLCHLCRLGRSLPAHARKKKTYPVIRILTWVPVELMTVGFRDWYAVNAVRNHQNSHYAICQSAILCDQVTMDYIQDFSGHRHQNHEEIKRKVDDFEVTS